MSTVLSRRRTSIVALGTSAVLGLGLTALEAPQATASASGSARHTADRPLYRDASRPIGQRVADLLHRMTLEEKIGQMPQSTLTPPRSPATTSAACSPVVGPCRRPTGRAPGRTWSTATRPPLCRPA